MNGYQVSSASPTIPHNTITEEKFHVFFGLRDFLRAISTLLICGFGIYYFEINVVVCDAQFVSLSTFIIS